ncbi:MAG TPA: hypothetical protein VFY27_00560 [Woeseiaceae bacterium]|nr:hypothetical protein [Woeseiaceae bacterium]
MRIASSLIAIVLSLNASVVFAAERSPYSGQQSRQIKALSEATVQGLLKGQGLGYAKAAELNGYPGPRHVLELAAELSLTEQQVRETESLFQRMETEAQKWGKELVESEMHLDEIFARRLVNEESLDRALKRVTENSARVRAAHLSAHVAQAAVLSREQIDLYVKLRGYEGMQHGGEG